MHYQIIDFIIKNDVYKKTHEGEKINEKYNNKFCECKVVITDPKKLDFEIGLKI